MNIITIFLYILLTVYVYSSIQITHFTAHKDSQLIYQPSPNYLLLSTSKGEITNYSNNGEPINTMNYVHSNRIVGIRVVNQINSVVKLVTADVSGLVVLWDEGMREIVKIIDLRVGLVGIAIGGIQGSGLSVLAINCGHTIWRYNLVTLQFIESIKQSDEIEFVQMVFDGFDQLVTVDGANRLSLYGSNAIKLKQIELRLGNITQLNTNPYDNSTLPSILFLVNNIKIVNYSFIHENYTLIEIDNYNKYKPQQQITSLSYYQNNDQQSLILASTSNQITIQGNTAQTRLKLQSKDILSVSSYINDSVLILSKEGKVTLIRIDKSGGVINIVVVVLICIFMVFGFGRCCPQFVPDIVGKFRRRKENQELGIQLKMKPDNLSQF